jgi:hypothetical protein
MKKHFLTSMFALIISCISIVAFSQKKAKASFPASPKWVSEKGYWVVENNKQTPKHSVIYFYDNNNELVYKEKIDNMRLNFKRKKVLLRLKSVLEQSVTSWQKQHIFKEDEMLVVVALKKRGNGLF